MVPSPSPGWTSRRELVVVPSPTRGWTSTEKMLRIAGVLAVVALGLSSTHTKGTVGEGQLPLCGAHLLVRYGFVAGECGGETVRIQRNTHLIHITDQWGADYGVGVFETFSLKKNDWLTAGFLFVLVDTCFTFHGSFTEIQVSVAFSTGLPVTSIKFWVNVIWHHGDIKRDFQYCLH